MNVQIQEKDRGTLGDEQLAIHADRGDGTPACGQRALPFRGIEMAPVYVDADVTCLKCQRLRQA